MDSLFGVTRMFPTPVSVSIMHLVLGEYSFLSIQKAGQRRKVLAE
jgi:hypothetical protein